jgi:hypothetical protein
VPIISLTWQLRAQTLVYPLFVVLLWLLVSDVLVPTRRVFLVLPLLVLWANLHGSVTLAALLVALRGMTYAGAAWRAGRSPGSWLPRSAALVLGPGLCIFASPYGFDLVGYYHRTLFNPSLSTYVAEWVPSTPSLDTAPFFVMAFGAVWLLGRTRSLTVFERVVLLVVLAASLASVRNVAWFGLTAVMVLPRALEEAWPSRSDSPKRHRLNTLIALGAVAAALVVTVVVAARPLSWLRQDWSPKAAAIVGRQAAADPSLRVLSTARAADWLLFTEPQLAGRMAFDIRLELLSHTQVKRFYQLENAIGDRWREATAGYRLLLIDPRSEGDLERVLLAESGMRTLYRGKRILVLSRPR